MSKTSLLFALSFLFAAPAAFAHAYLRASEPANGAMLKTPPKEVVIDFTEEVAPRFSGITVEDSQGRRVDTGDMHAENKDGTRFGIALKPLAPGVYTVRWHAVSADDGHKTAGSFHFTVLAP
jgi:methionine-rich copper-binding protein CopC